MDQLIVDLNQKIDHLTAQVAYLTIQTQINEKQRANREELFRDLAPIANQAFHLTIEQLEEIQDYIDLGDLLRLFKRLMRNGRNLEKILDQLESVTDLAATLGPLSDEAFSKVVDTLTSLEQKGYFKFAGSSIQIFDKIVTSFGKDDFQNLAENVEMILKILKEMTKPEIMNFTYKTLLAVENEVEKPVDSSLLGLLRQMGDPAFRRGMAQSMRMLQIIGDHTTENL